MSATKARLRSYQQLRALLEKIPNSYQEFKPSEVQPVLRQIVEEWHLDRNKLSEISGVPPMVVEGLVGWSDRRAHHQGSRNPNGDLSVVPDTRKLVNGLIAWIGPDESQLAGEESSEPGRNNPIFALGAHAKEFVGGAATAVATLEAELCNLTKTNQIEPLSEIASTLGRMERTIPLEGVQEGKFPNGLLAEIERLKTQVAALTEERDRLYALLKSSVSTSPLKSGFLQQVGALPVVAASAAVGIILGPEAIKPILDYVHLLVSSAPG